MNGSRQSSAPAAAVLSAAAVLTILTTLAILALLFAPAAAQAATVTGQIDLRGGSAPTPTPNLYGKYNGPTQVKSEARPGVVALMPIEGRAPRKLGQAPLMDQEDLTFKPHVLPVQKGTRVRFKNSDSYFHNVFSLSQTKSFDLGRYPKGQEETVVFNEAGVVPIFCDIHSDMKAFIVVIDSPYFTVTDPNGVYTISQVPDGQYELWVWREGQGKMYLEDTVLVTSHPGPQVPVK